MPERVAAAVREKPKRGLGLAAALAVLIAVAVMALLAVPGATTARADSLTPHQRAVLRGIAQDTWRFYAVDVDPTTHLPLDNLGPGSARATYTSAANIGVYLWAVVSAHDLGVIDTRQADQLARATLGEVATLKRYDGMLYQWYDTNNGTSCSTPARVTAPRRRRRRTTAGSCRPSIMAGTPPG